MLNINLKNNEVKFLTNFIKKRTEKCKISYQSTYSTTGKSGKRRH